MYDFFEDFREREGTAHWHKSLFHMRPPHITGAGTHLSSIKAETIPVALCHAMFFHICQPGIDDCLHYYAYRCFRVLSFNLSVYNDIELAISRYIGVHVLVYWKNSVIM